MPLMIKETKQFDKLMMMYFYYRGFAQINFDAKHKFYDYTMCKHYFFKLNYKDYLHIGLDFIQENLDDSGQFDFSLNDQEKKDNFTNLFSSFQQKIKNFKIKKGIKDIKKKEQMKGIELGFIDFFFQCYILFRDQKKNFKDKRYDLLKQTLNIYTKNQKFDLGVSQIHKCFFFLQDMQECEDFISRCLRVVRLVMKKEKLITHSQSEETIYEKFNEISVEEKLSISKVDNDKKPLLIKYLKQLSEIYIYSQGVIGFLNIYRCLSILSQSYYYKYLLYLEQLKWKARDLKLESQYKQLVDEIEKDLQKKNETYKLFWKLSYSKMKESFIGNQLNSLNVDIKNDQPILHIRKIMNNIFLQIQNQTDDNIFTVLFKVDYEIFLKKWKEHCEKIEKQNGKDNNVTAYTKSLRFKNQLVFVKMYSLICYQKPGEIEFSYHDYSFVQEVAIAIYLRDKQHQKYQSFHESIGYNCFNRYIYHFIQDNKIFLILEYYPILYQDILGNGHFKNENQQQNLNKQKVNIASQINSQREQRQQQNQKENSQINSTINSQSTLSQDTHHQSTQNNTIQQQQAEIDSNLNIPTHTQNSLNQMTKQNLQFTKKDLFSVMLRSEQAAHMLKENCIIHKDIKLLNIAMRNIREIVFIDNGISELFLEFSYYMDNSGTKLYRSYQQASSQPISENTDLTALIIVLYELIRGEKIDLINSGTDNYAAYISKYASKEINFMFSKDFIKLIEMICDSQLDTVKSRTKFFIWQKFEIFMNLLYDCLYKDSQIEYQKYYTQVKKAIIDIAVNRKKPNLEIQFDYKLLKNLISDDIFLMLVSLQSNNILKMYESLLFFVIKQRKMEQYHAIKIQIYQKFNISRNKLCELQYDENKLYESIEQYLYNDNTRKKYHLNTFQKDIISICQNKYAINYLQEKKYEFNNLEEQLTNILTMNEFDDSDKYFVINIFQKVYKYSIYQKIIDKLTKYMDKLEKQINQFQQTTCENIKKTYSLTDSIKEQIELHIKSYQTSKNFLDQKSQIEKSVLQNYTDEFEKQNTQHNSEFYSSNSKYSFNNFTKIIRDGNLTDQHNKTKTFLENENQQINNSIISSSNFEEQFPYNQSDEFGFNYHSFHRIEGEQTKRDQTKQRETMEKQQDTQKNDLNISQSPI